MPPDPRSPPRLLASVSSRAPHGSAANRWHEIDLHWLAPGFQLTIRFRSIWIAQGDRETTHQLLEITPDDLRQALALVDPCSDFAPHPDPRRRQQTSHAINSAWENACSQLLREASAWLT